MKGKILGLIVCGIAVLFGAYEFVAIADGVGGIPTISRMVQGLRDLGGLFNAISFGIAAIFVFALIRLAVWIWPHLREEERSEL
jgi:hypothetical protein